MVLPRGKHSVTIDILIDDYFATWTRFTEALNIRQQPLKWVHSRGERNIVTHQLLPRTHTECIYVSGTDNGCSMN